MKLNPEVKQKWLTALRSGEYRQGQGALSGESRDGKCFCCLGVLTDLYMKEHPDVFEWRDAGGLTSAGPLTRDLLDKLRTTGQPSSYVSYIPQLVAEWATGQAFGRCDYPNDFRTSKDLLSRLNDHGYDFNQIANVIEEEL